MKVSNLHSYGRCLLESESCFYSDGKIGKVYSYVFRTISDDVVCLYIHPVYKVPHLAKTTPITIMTYDHPVLYPITIVDRIKFSKFIERQRFIDENI